MTIIDATGNFHVVQCVNGEGLDTILTGGNANGSFPDDRGGGMINDDFVGPSNPIVANCIFSENAASFSGGAVENVGSSPMRDRPDVRRAAQAT